MPELSRHELDSGVGIPAYAWGDVNESKAKSRIKAKDVKEIFNLKLDFVENLFNLSSIILGDGLRLNFLY